MAVKPDRIQGKQVYAYVDSTPTRRIQTLDYTSNFTVDSVFELGNAGIVEDSVTLVETGITLNSNEWGSTDLEAMMFGIYEQRNVVNKSVSGTMNAVTTILVGSRGAGGSWSAVATTGAAGTYYVQVIRQNSSATVNVVEYSKVVGMSFSSASQCNILSLDTALAAAATAGDIVTLVNHYTVTQDTVDSNPVHFVLPHRYSSSSTAIMHSTLLPRCYVDNLTYRVDTGGAAEQNYSLVGEEERMTLNSRREAHSVTGSFSSYSGDTVVFTIPAESLSATASPYILYAAANTATAKNITHTSGQVTISAVIGSGLGIDANTQLVYYSTNKTKKGYHGLTNIDSGIGKITKGYVEVLLTGGVGDQYKLLRCTGLDVSVPLTRESIDELGTSTSIAKPLEGNLRNELTLNFSRNDLKEYAYINGAQVAWDDESLTEILMTDLKAIKNVTIEVKFYNNQTTHNTTTLLKTMTFTSCNFIGDNSTTTTSGAAGLELKFSTQSLSIVGSGRPPVYS